MCSKMKKLIIFSAPSGAGKTTIVKHLLQENLGLEFSISACSRKKRAGEIDGKDYYFLDLEVFKKKISDKEFVEWEEVYQDHFYGTLRSELERIWQKGQHVLFDVDVKGGVNLKKQFGEQALALFVMPPSIEELKNRLIKRATDSVEVIRERVAKAKEELTYAKQFDKTIVNDKLELAQNEAVILVSDFLSKQS